jgi:hypothetical protein
MQRILMLAAAVALVAASPALAGKGGPPYKLDVKGKCHDSSGGLTTQTLCGKASPAPLAPVGVPLTHTSTPRTVVHRSTPIGLPHCNAGNKPCGKSCIAIAKTCHV